MIELRNPVLAVVGSTASGKTALAQSLAENLDGEVLSADSMQIYRGMDIGTGKIRPEERTVPYHGLDLACPGEAFSAALFQEYARKCMSEIDSRGRQVVLCGGTGLYLRAALDDFRFPKGGQVDNQVRTHYARLCEEEGGEALWKLLQERDPASAELVHPHNVRRVIRAFEMLEEGTSYAEQHEKLQRLPQVVPALMLGLEVETVRLNARIEARVDAMFAEGLVEEVEELLKAGFREAITASQAIGYKEVVAALDGRCTLEEAVREIKTATRRYAKRQRSWFRKDKRIIWLDANKEDSSELCERACDLLVSKREKEEVGV